MEKNRPSRIAYLICLKPQFANCDSKLTRRIGNRHDKYLASCIRMMAGEPFSRPQDPLPVSRFLKTRDLAAVAGSCSIPSAEFLGWNPCACKAGSKSKSLQNG